MNKIKLLLLWLVTPLLSGVTFGLSYDILDFSNTDNNWNYAVVNHTWVIVVASMWCNVNQRNCNIVLTQGQVEGYYANSYISNSRTQFIDTQPINVVPWNVYIVQTNVQYFDSALFYAESSWWWSCDYSEYESTISTLSWSLATCQNSLSQCQASNCDTQLSQCIIDRDNLSSSVTSLSWSLASCNEDKTSLQNYNNSLSSQLDECLLWSSWENLSWSCIDYSLFWQDDETMFSLPITNNLFLPNGYKWKLDEDNVLSIAKLNTLETAYHFDDTDKTTVINSMSLVMLFFLGTGLLIVVIMYLRRFISKK